MVVYFIFAMAVMFCADFAFKLATGGWWPKSKVGRYSNVGANLAISGLVLWLAFWYESLFFLWIVFVLAVVVLFWILVWNPSMVFRQNTQ
jgi:hypothetical protein